MRKVVYIIALIFGSIPVLAQGIHLSNYGLMPALYNPAWNQAIDQDLNLGVIHRNQSYQITPNSYQTLGAYIQARLASGIRENDNLHIHGMFISDESGKGQLQQTNIALGLTYHLAIDPLAKHVLSFAVRGSNQQINLSGLNELLFEEDLTGNGFSEDITFGQVNNVDWTIGLAQHSRFSDRVSAWGGFALGSVNYYYTDEKEASVRINAHLAMEYLISPQISLSPRLYYQDLRSSQNVIAQLVSGFKVNSNSNVVVEFGIGQRFGDAFQVLTGIQYESWRLGFSSDIGTSSLADAVGGSSAFELGLMYSFNFPKKVYKPRSRYAISDLKKPSISIEREPVIRLSFMVFDSSHSLTEGHLKVIDTTTGDTAFISNRESTLPDPSLLVGRDYQIIVNKEGYYVDTILLSTHNIQSDTVLVAMSWLETVPPDVVKVEIGTAVRLNNIYYDYNDYRILDASEKQLDLIYRAMNTYPDLVIEITAHTDARGGDDFNLELSKKRARAVIDWLKTKGISESRLVSKGLGETQLLNNCSNGVDCTEDQHRVNRRTEFKILKGPDVIYLK